MTLLKILYMMSVDTVKDSADPVVGREVDISYDEGYARLHELEDFFLISKTSAGKGVMKLMWNGRQRKIRLKKMNNVLTAVIDAALCTDADVKIARKNPMRPLEL